MSNPVPDLETLRPDAPTALVDLVFRMLEKAPEARIPSVRLVGAELEAILSQLEDDSSSIGVARRVVHTERFATPILSTTVVKRNFPAQTTPFVGREREVVEIDNLLRNTDLRLITLLGPGGAGKTRLSIQAAERQAGNFEDGLYFVPLSPLDTAENIIPTIADAVDYQFQPDARGLEVQLLDFLRDKRLLLLLDNFEHLIDGVNVVVDILSTAPNVKILVTSRERLRLRDEQIFEVHGLYLPPEGITPEELQEYSAAKLFLQSARRVRPGFEINSKTASHIVRICHLVDGMPLGIELAASWLEALSVEEVAGEIEQSLDFLETDLRDVPQRHRSIRTVFDYSWDLLTEDERDTFMKLSIFRGGFEREAAQYVTGASLRTLSHLVSKSLLKRDPSGRYDLHKMLRQYTERHFDQHPDKEQTNRSFVTYFSEFAYKLEPVFNSKSEKHALDQVELEIENIRTAWRWASEHQDWQALDKLMHTMMLFYLGISMLREGLEVFNKLVEALDYLEEERTFWRACVRQTWLAGRLGEFSQVWEISNDAYHYFKQHGEKTEAAYALNNMSYACMMQGRYQESIQHAAEAGELSANASDSTAWFMAMGNRGYAEFLAGNYEEARNLYEVMLQYAEIKDYSLSGRAYGLNNLGEILRELGDLEKARQLFQQAHGVFKSYRHRQGMAFTMNNLAEVHAIQGNYMEAGRIYAQAYRLNKDIGDRAGIGHSLSALGSVAFYSRDYEGAAAYFRQALELASEFNLIDVVPHALVGIASVLATTGERERALVIIASVQRSLRTSMPVSIDQKTTHLADQLTSELPEDVSRAAVERGTQLEIGTVIADLVS